MSRQQEGTSHNVRDSWVNGMFVETEIGQNELSGERGRAAFRPRRYCTCVLMTRQIRAASSSLDAVKELNDAARPLAGGGTRD